MSASQLRLAAISDASDGSMHGARRTSTVVTKARTTSTSSIESGRSSPGSVPPFRTVDSLPQLNRKAIDKAMSRSLSSTKSYGMSPYTLVFERPEVEAGYARFSVSGHQRRNRFLFFGVVAVQVLLCVVNLVRGAPDDAVYPVLLAPAAVALVAAGGTFLSVDVWGVLAAWWAAMSTASVAFVCNAVVALFYASPTSQNSLLVLALYLALAPLVLNIEMRHANALNFVLVCTFAVLATVGYHTKSMDARPFATGSDVVENIMLLLLTSVLFCLASYNFEKLDRKSYFHQLRVEEENSQLAALNTRLTRELQTGDDDDKHVDTNAPFEKVMSMLKTMLANGYTTPAVRAQLKYMQALMTSSSNIYLPNMRTQLDRANLSMDKEVRDWLILESGTSQATVVRHARRKGQRHLAATRIFGGRVTLGDVLHLGRRKTMEYAVREVMADDFEHWAFDVFRTAAMSPEPLLQCTREALDRLGLVDSLGIEKVYARNYLQAIERGYGPLPYHCAMHGADVVQGTFFFLTTGGLMERCDFGDLEILSAIISAAVHDVDHPGTSNAFQVATRTQKAILYNDRSVLENHHVSCAFAAMQQEGCNVLSCLDEGGFRAVRKLVIEIVLATDLAAHFGILAAFRAFVESEKLPESDDDRLLLLKMAVKSADIGNAVRPFHIHIRWTARIMEEFFNQGDRERALGLPISPFMDRNAPTIPKCQVGFADFLVAPLFDAWLGYLPRAAAEIMHHRASNYAEWKSRLDSCPTALIDVDSELKRARQMLTRPPSPASSGDGVAAGAEPSPAAEAPVLVAKKDFAAEAADGDADEDELETTTL